MILQLKRWICGWLRLRISGSKTGRFLSLCMNHGIDVWDVEENDAFHLEASVFLYDIPKLRKLRAKAGVHLAFIQRHGLIFGMRKHPLWPYWLATATICLFLFYQYKSRIWYVQIDGNSYLSEETCNAYLQAAGYEPGIRSSQLDCKRLCNLFLQQSTEISWASIGRSGQTLVVDIRENLDAQNPSRVPEVNDLYQYSLIADQNAVVTSIVTRSGTPLVKAGDSVMVGDVLIQGKEAILDDSGAVADYLYLPADGDVRGKVNCDREWEIPGCLTKRTNTGNRDTRYLIGIGEYYLKFPGIYPDYCCKMELTEYTQISLLPFWNGTLWIARQTVLEQEENLYQTNRKLAEQEAQNKFANYLLELEEAEITVQTKTWELEYTGSHYRVLMHVEGEAPIGCYQKEGIVDYEYERSVD